MPSHFNKPHIDKIEDYAIGHRYIDRKRKIEFPIRSRNRDAHGRRILRQLEAIRQQFEIEEDSEIPENIVKDDAIYVSFVSDWDYPLKFEQLNQNTDVPKYQIINIKQEQNPENENQFRYKVLVMLTKGGISHFIKKAEEYLTENIKDREGNLTDKPKSYQLISNIQNIQIAALQAFWSDESEINFPDYDVVTWWEAWFRKTNEGTAKINAVENNLTSRGAVLGELQLEFPEHYVRLVRGTASQLSQSLMLLDNLAELRKPQVLSDVISLDNVTYNERDRWLRELLSHIEHRISDNSVLICLLDSGVNNQHPLINPSLPDNRLYSLNPDWGKFDGERGGGHGTGMAGLTLYGDLTEVILYPANIQIRYGLESFKIYNPNSANNPKLYGAIYELACSKPIVDRPENIRVFCLSVTNKDFVFHGRPSSSSASIDKIAFGNTLNPPDPQLILVSGGNVIIERAEEYPLNNFYESIQDPAQAYNALTVGSYTRKINVNQEQWPGWRPLANCGAFAPSNSTSGTWETKWPNKPDIVMEGGNLGYNGNDVSYLDSLQLLTTHKNSQLNIFQTFGQTSAAVALASKMAAELRTEYPNYWPETIRALIVNSAVWTEEMLTGKNLDLEADRRSILRSVGYGVPNLEKARYSANNCLTMLAQRTIQPFRVEDSKVKYNEYHLYELPWPVDVLRDGIGDNDVTIKVTLSYFIEPNPGNRQYATNFRYHSHGLDFKLIKPTETIEMFRRRVSAASLESEETDDDTIDTSAEDWTLRERIRSKGSIKKDFLTTSGISLANRNVLAVYPKNGWYRTRKILGKVESLVRYSLIISLETPEVEIDLYTPVLTAIQTSIPINT
ncbi:MAG TPA: S8 family peptidase [Bacteroidales bacterium]|nr:S8 family peptidase [Bacteroidales bacterium]